MRTKAFSIARGAATLLLGGLAMAGRAHAQRDEQIGGVRLHVEADSDDQSDRSYAMLRPEGKPQAGSLVWACGGSPDGFAAELHIPDVPEERTVRTVWRLDGGAADSADLFNFSRTRTGLFGTLDGAPLTKLVRIATRARTAARLVVRLHPDIPGRAPTEYVYSLAGVDSALKRLGCATGRAHAPAPSGPDGHATLSQLISTTSGATQPLALRQEPRLLNGDEVQRRMTRRFPRVRGERVEGAIFLVFRVIGDGTVDPSSISIDRSSHPELNRFAMEAVQTARFRPATEDGRPVKRSLTIAMGFTAAPSRGANASRPSP